MCCSEDGTHCEVTAAAASTAVSPTKNALPVLRFMHRDHPSLYPGQVQVLLPHSLKVDTWSKLVNYLHGVDLYR